MTKCMSTCKRVNPTVLNPMSWMEHNVQVRKYLSVSGEVCKSRRHESVTTAPLVMITCMKEHTLWENVRRLENNVTEKGEKTETTTTGGMKTDKMKGATTRTKTPSGTRTQPKVETMGRRKD